VRGQSAQRHEEAGTVTWWNDSSGWWFVMPLLMVVFWVGVIWLVVSVFRGLVARPSGEGGRPERPEEILARR
jgi:hypothetical protein